MNKKTIDSSVAKRRLIVTAVALSLSSGWAAADSSKDAVLAGRVRFNDQCSHCHSTDGASPVRERDLRRLRVRYAAEWRATAEATIKSGRLEYGMPSWNGILGEPEIEQILGFLATVQK